MKRSHISPAYNFHCLTHWGCLFLLLLLATACTSPSPIPKPITATAQDTPRPTYTSPFIPTRTPAPTYTPTQTYTEEERQARRLLSAKAYDTFDCEASFPGCNGTFALRVLEFLHAYPQTSYRTTLIERVMDTSIGNSQRLQMEWLIDEWAEQALVGPFQAAGGLPEGFAESWQRGSILPGDLDNDDKNDYVVVAKTLPGTDALSPIWLYWLYERDGQWRQEQLAKAASSFGMNVLPTGDVNSDGQNDLAYTLTHCGASTCTKYLYLFTHQDQGWQRLPVLTRYGGNEPAQNGGWSFSPEPDGSMILVMEQGGPGSNSAGPIVSYRIAFRWQTNAFVPVNISPIENSLGLPTLKIQWADRLAASGRFTETLPVLQEALNENGRGGFRAFYPAFILFRLGMAYLYLEQPTEARAAWAQLVQEYPDMAISQDVSRLSALIDQPVSAAAPAWQVCDWYLRERPDWWLPQTDPALIHYSAGDKYPFDVYTWCDPWLLVTLQPWERAQPLEEQAARLGLDWQLLSDAYDLNGDGMDDPIGVIEGEAWAFLSAGEHYQPLYAESELPLGAIREPFHGSPGYPNERTLQVADLDDNGMPEIWVFEDSWLLAWVWQSWHFESQWQQFHLENIGYQGKARLEDGAVRVRIAEYPYAEERVIGEWIYQLVDGSLQRIDPPVQPERSLATLSAAIEALYRQDDPQRALQMLDGFVPQAAEQVWNDDPMEPDWIFDADWERAAACALQALAYEHLDDYDAAMQEWRLILQKYPQTAWAGLAVDIGGLPWPTPAPVSTTSPMPTTPTPTPTVTPEPVLP